METLSHEESRVLGTLIEKSLATPDYYPMNLNALRNACNQKSSREPVTNYSDETVQQALSGLKRKCYVTFLPYGPRGDTHKYRHFLDDVRYGLKRPHLALLTVLLLRGPQTLNELRTRTASMHPFDSMEETESALKELATREQPPVLLIPKRLGWKEPRWRHLFHEEPQESVPRYDESMGRQEYTEELEMQMPSTVGVSPALPGQLETLRDEVAALRAELAELRQEVEAMRAELGG